MGTPGYTVRETVKAALDGGGGSRADAQIDRLIAAASRQIELRMHRVFYPWHGTRLFTWPDRSRTPSWMLELGNHELIALDSLTTAGELIDVGQVLLEPVNDGPPFTRIELNRGGPAAFRSGDTPQQSVAVTGLFGYRDDERRVARLLAGITADDTAVLVDSGAYLGTGSLIRIGDERAIVERLDYADTGLTTTEVMADKAHDALVYLSGSAGAPDPGEVIAVGVERMLVTERIGPVCAVRRAVDGSQLLDHADGTAVFARRSLVLERGVCGTAAADHALSAAVYRFEYPAPIETLCIEEVLALKAQEDAGMARVVGSQGAEQETSARGLADARKQADVYRRRNRNWAV